MKRFLSIILASILLFSALPLTAVAADTDDVQTSGKSESQDVMNDDDDTADAAGESPCAVDELVDNGAVEGPLQASSPANNTELADTGAAEELAPISVGPDKYSGMTGSCRWELTPNDGLLHIYTSGSNGQIVDYTESNPAPWYSYRNYIKTLWIEKKVTYIGSYSFYGCTNLTTASLPSTINFMGASAFNYCTSLQSISLASTSIEAIYSNTFYNCNSMPSCELPSTLKWIGTSAFEKCYSLASMTIPENVESIGSRAFMNCTVLKSVTVNENLREIADHAFAYCFALENIDIPSGMYYDIGEYAFEFCTSLKNVNFYTSDDIYGIGAYAFFGCSSLSEIDIPSCVYDINDGAFKNCTSLEDVTFHEGLVNIYIEAFSGCSSLSRVEMPSSAKYIGYNVFERCTSLSVFNCADSSIEEINEYAFLDCTELEGVYLNHDISCINSFTFQNCTSLYHINLDWKNLTLIKDHAFLNCTSLAYVDLNDGLEEVEEDAFTGCTSLDYLAFGSGIETLDPHCCGYSSRNSDQKIKDFALYGYAGTEPERYANQYGFTFIPYNLISSVSVSDIVAPVGGEHPSYTATLPADKGYKMGRWISSGWENGIRWYCLDDGEYLEKTDVFEAGKRYELTVCLENDAEKYRFREFGFTATLNGITSGIERKVNPKEVYLYYTFTAPAKVVTSVSVSNVTAPVAGAKPSTSAFLPLNSGYKLDTDYYASGIGWFDEDDYYMNPANNERFVEGKTYTLRVQLVPTKGYEFTNSGLTATINGSSAGVTIVEPRYKILLSTTYTCTASGTVITGAKISGTVTSFLDSSGKVTVKLERTSIGGSTVVGEKSIYGNSTYQFTGLNLNGFYRLTVSKANHVTRSYNVIAKASTTQDVKICPKGDTNNDGSVKANDATMAYRHAQGKSLITDPYQFACANVAGNDSYVKANDATQIYRQAQGKHSLW